MESGRVIIYGFVLTIVASILIQPCFAQRQRAENNEDIWAGEELRRPRWEHGPPRLSNDMVDRIMKDLQKKDPAKAKELAELRQKDPERFDTEIRRLGREEFGRMVREHMEMRRQRWQTEFIEWFEKNYPQDAEELAKLKVNDPELYIAKLEHIVKRYRSIFEASRENPELAEVLKEDLELKKKRDELLMKIGHTSDEQEKQELIAQLQNVVSSRYELIVRRKQIAYEQLLKKLEELKQRVKESRDEIAKWRNEDFKAENVKNRLKDLTEGISHFRWD